MRHTFLDVGSLSLQTEYARFENGRFVYRISRSPMCEYMINFIHKLKHLPEKYMMNSVLENFTILLVRMSYSESSICLYTYNKCVSVLSVFLSVYVCVSAHVLYVSHIAFLLCFRW